MGSVISSISVNNHEFMTRKDVTVILNDFYMYDVKLKIAPTGRNSMEYYLIVTNIHTKEEEVTRGSFSSLQKVLDMIVSKTCIAFDSNDRQQLLKQLESMYSHCDSKYGMKVKDYFDGVGDFMGNCCMYIKGKSMLDGNVVLNFIGIGREEVKEKLGSDVCNMFNGKDITYHYYGGKLVGIAINLEAWGNVDLLDFMDTLKILFDAYVVVKDDRLPENYPHYEGFRLIVDRELKEKYKDLI